MKTPFDDGASTQAKIVLALLASFEIEESWDSARCEYTARMDVNRWHNCRERGYSVAIRPKKWLRNQDVHIAWAEHRNSDDIVVYEYKGILMNPLTVHDMNQQPESWSGKHFPVGQWQEAADYIKERLLIAWKSEPKEKTVTFP